MPRRKRAQAGQPDANPMPDTQNPMLGSEALLEQTTPFEESDDPDAQTLADEYNDPQRVDLAEHDEGPITGYQAVPQPPLDEFDSSPVVGRPTSPPLWASAHLHPNVSRLRVWKIENGVPVSIGAIDARASEDDFIRYFYANMPKTGEHRAEFKIRPLDMLGREVMQERALPPIDENHASLRKMRAVNEAAASGSNPPAWWSPPAPVGPQLSEILQVAKELQAPMAMRLEAAEVEAREARRMLHEMLARTSEREVELAARTGTTVEAMTDRILQNDAKRNESLLAGQQNLANQAIGQQSSLFATLLESQRRDAERDKAHAMDIAREAAGRRDQDRSEAEDRRQRERMEYEMRLKEREMEMSERREREHMALDRERDDQRRRDEERDRERQRMHDSRMKEMELQAQRDREHAERMMTINQSRDKGESAEGFIEKGVKMMALLGMKPGDLIERFGGGSSDLYAPAIEGGLKLVETAVQSLADYAKAHKTAESNKEIAATQAAAAMQIGATPAGAMIAGPILAQHPAGDVVTGAAGAEPVLTATVVPTVPVIESKLSLTAQKVARTGIRELVADLRRTADETQWEGVVMRHIGVNMTILHYAKEQSLKVVLREAGLDEGTLAKIVEFVVKLNHPMLSDIPLG